MVNAFSGGPVVWYHPNDKKIPQIIGTISGYLNEPITASETMEDDERYNSSAGIIEAYWFIDLFDAF